MLFHVELIVEIPPDANPDQIAKLSAEETALAKDLQRSGTWRHIWRVVGRRANISIFDVKDAEELHGILSGLPLFPYMRITVVPLCRHPAKYDRTD